MTDTSFLKRAVSSVSLPLNRVYRAVGDRPTIERAAKSGTFSGATSEAQQDAEITKIYQAVEMCSAGSKAPQRPPAPQDADTNTQILSMISRNGPHFE